MMVEFELGFKKYASKVMNTEICYAIQYLKHAFGLKLASG